MPPPIKPGLLTSLALTTHDVIVTATDATGAAVIGATVKLTARKSGQDVDAQGVSWPVTMEDQGDGTYRWRYPDSFRTALGTSGTVTFVLEADNGGVVAYAEVGASIVVDRT